MKSDEQFDRLLNRLTRASEQAADRDAARVALGFEDRVMRRIQASGQGGDSTVDLWARVFYRAAFGSMALTAVLALAVWFSGSFAAVEDRVAFTSGFTVQLWPNPW